MNLNRGTAYVHPVRSPGRGLASRLLPQGQACLAAPRTATLHQQRPPGTSARPLVALQRSYRRHAPSLESP